VASSILTLIDTALTMVENQSRKLEMQRQDQGI
jgi:hypothetical protein